MQKSVWDLFRVIFPLGKAKRAHLEALKAFLDRDELSYAKYLLKLGKLGVSYGTFGISKDLFREEAFPQLHTQDTDEELHKLVAPWNDRIRRAAQEKDFHLFASHAHTKIPSLIAPHIIGFDDVKKAAAWQLFSPETFHVLLLGDPGTGKTDILRGAAQLAPISSFGLGSGTSGVGLVAAKKGGELIKGLLPLAHQGVCCIDELNLMKTRDRGALLNAMEKGFVTYDKASSHIKLPAKVRILATANPKGDRFIGSKVKFLKSQMPFDPALLSRFHVIFLIRRPDKDEFMKITKSIVNEKSFSLKKEDLDFLREYVAYAQKQPCEFNKELEPVVTDFFEDLKDKEDEMLIELSPRLVLGVVRMSKAIARMSLRDRVVHDDLIAALSVVDRSLRITEDTQSKNVRKTKK